MLSLTVNKKALVSNDSNVNLLSVAMMCDSNRVIVFSKEKAFVFDNNQQIEKLLNSNKHLMEGKRSPSNMYMVTNPVLTAQVKNNIDSLNWHVTLGHRSYQYGT